jgi:glycine hydroxymethyltransferase
MLSESDQEIFEVILQEKHRQEETLGLIPSENLASKAVLEALGSVLSNKYSEGYIGRRYYAGNNIIDMLEQLAIERAKQLFGCEHANVQPLSGSPANHAVFFALMELGDTFMGLDLASGGHLTHGNPVNFSGKSYRCVPYFVDRETELLDYDVIKKLALQERPRIIISGYTAYPRKIDFKAFQEIAELVDAYHMADISHIAGLVAGGVHESPVPFADVVTTTTHKTLRGPRGAMIMCKKEDRLREKYHPESKKDLAAMLDFAVFPGLQGGPHDNANAAKAVCFQEALQPEFKSYSEQIVKNAKVLAEELMTYGFRLVSGGTDNHLILIDMTNKEISGAEAAILFEEVNIITNKNTIPYDTRKPMDPSGIRIGTPLLTTKGMQESEMKSVAEYMAKAVEHRNDPLVKEKLKQDVIELACRFPFYE